MIDLHHYHHNYLQNDKQPKVSLQRETQKLCPEKSTVIWISLAVWLERASKAIQLSFYFRCTIRVMMET